MKLHVTSQTIRCHKKSRTDRTRKLLPGHVVSFEMIIENFLVLECFLAQGASERLKSMTFVKLVKTKYQQRTHPVFWVNNFMTYEKVVTGEWLRAEWAEIFVPFDVSLHVSIQRWFTSKSFTAVRTGDSIRLLVVDESYVVFKHARLWELSSAVRTEADQVLALQVVIHVV